MTDDIAERVRLIRDGVRRVGELTTEAGTVLMEMASCLEDRPRVARLLDRLLAIGRRAEAIEPAYQLVQFFTPTGTFNRMRVDRLLNLNPLLSPAERHRRQIERDRANVETLARSANDLGAILEGIGV